MVWAANSAVETQPGRAAMLGRLECNAGRQGTILELARVGRPGSEARVSANRQRSKSAGLTSVAGLVQRTSLAGNEVNFGTVAYAWDSPRFRTQSGTVRQHQGRIPAPRRGNLDLA